MGNDNVRGSEDPAKGWVRIPDGTKVKHRLDGYEGIVDGLTAIVQKGAILNPDRRTQYRVNVDDHRRRLAGEDDLLILVDREGLLLVQKATVEYRRILTDQLRGVFAEDRFTT